MLLSRLGRGTSLILSLLSIYTFLEYFGVSLQTRWRSQFASQFHSDAVDHALPSAARAPSFRIFNSTRDRNNHYMTDSQCASAFPRLYTEIDRAADYWSSREDGKYITPKNIDLSWSHDGGLRCMIYDRQLYIISSRGLNHFGHWAERHRATLHSIHRALMTSPEDVPNIEFSIKINDDVGLTDDAPNSTFWTFLRDIENRNHDRLWVIPDFNFWAYPRVAGSFSDFQSRAIEVGANNFDNKINKLVWRGTVNFNPEVRVPLLEQSADQPWSDVVRVDEDVQQDTRITMDAHCQYKFAAHTEGTTWSGRLKYLLQCNSVVVSHSLRYYTHLYHLLRPEGVRQNYVSVQRDWSDLREKMDHLSNDNEKARAIAENAAATFRDRYATPAAQTCYLRHLFRVWRKASFEPEPYEDVTQRDGTVYKIARGMTYEEYMSTDGIGDVP